MAKLVFAYPIEEVHGKLKGKFGSAMRSTANAKGERYCFSTNYGTRSTQPSSAELANRTRFGAVSAIAAARRVNPTKKAQDQAGFKNQTTTSYKTLQQYIFNVAAAEYDAAQD